MTATAIAPAPASRKAHDAAQRLAWQRNDDGTYDVFGAYVFGEVKAGAKGKSAPAVTRDWLERALARSTKLAEGGYSGPVVIRHTYRQDGQIEPTQRRAGSFVLRDVVDGSGKPGLDGPVLRADFLRVSQEAFDGMRSGQFPSVSVEVGSYSDPSIAKIALLDTEEPFFKFPHLAIGREIAPDEARAMSSYRAEPSDESWFRGYLHVGERHEYLFRASHEFAADAEKKDGDDAEMAQLAKRLAPYLVAELSRAEVEQINTDRSVAPVTPQEMSQMSDNAATPTTDPKDKPQGDTSALERQFSELSARLAAMEQRDRAREAKDQAGTRAAAALAALSGYTVDETTEKSIRQFAETATPENLDAFVETLKRHLPQQIDTLDQLAARYGVERQEQDVPEEVKAYRAKGPEQYEAALSCFRQFNEARDRGFRDISLADFLKTNLDFHTKRSA